ncbi:MAG: N-formylglutamate amidohydrolase [Myxococcales bacterium]|nr:N-formylglutamate amidohydrolase [Myxococcales bacterium]
MTAPFRIVRPPPDSERPVVVSSPHSGVAFPPNGQAAYARDERALAADGDLFVDELYENAPEHGAVLLSATYSRFVVDLNRHADDLSPRSVQGAIERTAPGYYGPRGVIWAVDTRGRPIYRSPLSAADADDRIRRYHRPYHDALGAELERLHARFGYVILLDAHSMPSRAAAMHPDAGELRADVVPGDVHGRTCGRWLMELTQSWWERAGRTVSPNRPYSGGAIVRTHANPARGVHGIQLELNRGLYMDESRLVPSAGFERLRAEAAVFVRALCGAAPPGAAG